MKKLLAVLSVVALVSPGLAFAAADTVTLTKDVVSLSVGGFTVNVTGTNATIASITVGASSFSFDLESGSYIKVTAPNGNQLIPSTASDQTTWVCTSSESSASYTGTTAHTVTITPDSILCSSNANAGQSGSSGNNSSGGSIAATPATPATPATVTTPAVPATPATPTAHASGLSSTQIQSILDVLASFDADAATIALVKASLEGTTTGSITSAAVHAFKSDLQLGNLGSEVKALQEFLNAHGYTVSANGAGSPGNETTKFGSLTKAALIKFQKANNITPAVGYFGPKTRAAMNVSQ